MFSDMDGTLLQSDKTISNNSLKIIKNLQNNQKLFGIATGRPYYFLKQEIALLNPDLPIISCNGALIYDYKKNELIYSNSFSEMQNETIINILIKNNITFLIYSTNKMYGYSNQKHSKWFDWINASNETKSPQYRSDFVAINKIETQNLLKQKIDIVKFLIIKTDSNNDDLIQAQKELKLIEEIYLVQSHKDVIDIMKVNSTKGNGIEIIAKKFNLNLNKTLVFGDENNDISMFEKAKFSVAMFQASDLVKKSATFITKSNDEDGISYFIENNL
nr:HAD family hydrolase [[Mycoplasma] collis]